MDCSGAFYSIIDVFSQKFGYPWRSTNVASLVNMNGRFKKHRTISYKYLFSALEDVEKAVLYS